MVPGCVGGTHSLSVIPLREAAAMVAAPAPLYAALDARLCLSCGRCCRGLALSLAGSLGLLLGRLLFGLALESRCQQLEDLLILDLESTTPHHHRRHACRRSHVQGVVCIQTIWAMRNAHHLDKCVAWYGVQKQRVDRKHTRSSTAADLLVCLQLLRRRCCCDAVRAIRHQQHGGLELGHLQDQTSRTGRWIGALSSKGRTAIRQGSSHA